MKLKITVDNKAYDVDVEILEEEKAPPRSFNRPIVSVGSAGHVASASKTSPSAQETVADEAKVVRSPVVGIVVRVNCKPGENVSKNQTVVLLEAMKMESAVNVPIDATVKEIRVSEGDSVQSGQVLVVFE